MAVLLSHSGYTPVFGTVFDGSLYGKWPDSAVWLTMLALCDSRGNVDMSHEAIAGRTGWPMELLRQGIAALLSPDPRSRSSAEEGRRLVLLDPGRDWGWRIVNVQLYRRKASNRVQVDDGRNAEKVRRYKAQQKTPQDTAGHPETPADTQNTNSYSDTNASKRARNKRASRLPEDFSPDLEYARKAIPDIEAEAEFARFRDYWTAKSGANGTKADWPATWRNWIRNCQESGRYARRKEEARAPRGLPVLNG